MQLCRVEHFFNITSESKKPGQIIVVIHYCNLSRFFWLRRYVLIESQIKNVLVYAVMGIIQMIIFGRNYINSDHSVGTGKTTK